MCLTSRKAFYSENSLQFIFCHQMSTNCALKKMKYHLFSLEVKQRYFRLNVLKKSYAGHSLWHLKRDCPTLGLNAVAAAAYIFTHFTDR